MATRKKATKKKRSSKKKAATKKPVAPATAETPDKEPVIIRDDLEIYDKRLLLTKPCIAALCGVTVSTVEKWGLKPVQKVGREVFYYGPEVIEFRFGLEGGRLDAGQEKAMLDKVRREQAELELKKKRGDLLEIKPLLVEWERVLSGVRQKLYAIPTKIAKPFSMNNNPQAIKADLEDRLDESLQDAEDFVEGLREKEREYNKRKRNREGVRRFRANQKGDVSDSETAAKTEPS